MSSIRLKLSPPWITYINKLKALFEPDPEITITVSDEDKTIYLESQNGDKNTALLTLLPQEKYFGNIYFDIIILGPISNISFPTQKALFDTAFAGNPVYAYSIMPDESWFFSATYVVFKNCVVQFFNDNLNDCHGLISTLYQDIALEIFEDANLYCIYYNTDIEPPCAALDVPTEWP